MFANGGVQADLDNSSSKSKELANTENMFTERFAYHPTGGVGLRFSQHFFLNEADKVFIDGLPHLE